MPKKTKRRTVSVDMTGVEAGGKAVPDGVYAVEVAEVTQEEGDKADYLKWKFRITDGSCKGAVVYDNTSLSPAALWRLKGLLECLGVDVPDSSMELDLDEYVGMEMTITVANEEFQGKDRPKVAQYGGEVDESSGKGAKSSGAESSDSSGRKKTASKKNDDDDDADRPKAGDRVSFEDQGKTYKGKIKSIEDDMATVLDDSKDEWDIPLKDLTVI